MTYKPTKLWQTPPIAFAKATEKTISKTNSATFKLRLKPTEEASPVYEETVAYFSTGSLEECITFRSKVARVIKGMNVTTGPEQYDLIRRLLRGNAMTWFSNAASAVGNETVTNLQEVLKRMTKPIEGDRALVRQKRYMQRYMRKSSDTKIRDYDARFRELEECLTYFSEYSPEKKFDDDEVIDIFECAVPSSWNKHMLNHGFEPTEHTRNEFVEYCSRIEWAEATNALQSGTKSNAKSKTGTQYGNKRLPSSQIVER